MHRFENSIHFEIHNLILNDFFSDNRCAINRNLKFELTYFIKSISALKL
jgi:hypothetical protein